MVYFKPVENFTTQSKAKDTAYNSDEWVIFDTSLREIISILQKVDFNTTDFNIALGVLRDELGLYDAQKMMNSMLTYFLRGVELAQSASVHQPTIHILNATKRPLDFCNAYQIIFVEDHYAWGEIKPTLAPSLTESWPQRMVMPNDLREIRQSVWESVLYYRNKPNGLAWWRTYSTLATRVTFMCGKNRGTIFSGKEDGCVTKLSLSNKNN